MGGKTKKDRKSLSGFIRSIFFQSATAKSLDKNSKNHSSAKDHAQGLGEPIEFGVGETEKLKHFQRARPPANRRPPRALNQQRSQCRQSVQSMPSIAEKRELHSQETRLGCPPPLQHSQSEGEAHHPSGVPSPPSAKDKPVKLREDVSEEVDTQKRMSQSVPNLNSHAHHDDRDAKRASRKKNHHERRSFWNIFNRFPKRPMEGSNSDWILVQTVEGTLDRDSTDGLVEIKDNENEMEHDGQNEVTRDGQIDVTELRKNSRNLETDLLPPPAIRAQSLKIESNLGQCNSTTLSELLKATHPMSMPAEAVN